MKRILYFGLVIVFLFSLTMTTSTQAAGTPYWAGYESKELSCNECESDWYIQIKYSKDGKKYKANFKLDDTSFGEHEGTCEGKVFANGVLERKVCVYTGSATRSLGGTVKKLELTGDGNAGDATWIDKRILAKKKASPKSTIFAKTKKKSLKPIISIKTKAGSRTPYWAGFESKQIPSNDGLSDFIITIKYSKDGKKYKITYLNESPHVEGTCEGEIYKDGDLEEIECEKDSGGTRTISGTVTEITLESSSSAGGGTWKLDKKLLIGNKPSPKPGQLAKAKKKSLKPKVSTKTSTGSRTPYWAGYESKVMECDECDTESTIKIKYSKDGKNYNANYILDDKYEFTCKGKVFANGKIQKVTCDSADKGERFDLLGHVTKLKIETAHNYGGAIWTDTILLAKEKTSPKPVILVQKKSKRRKLARKKKAAELAKKKTATDSKTIKSAQKKTSSKMTFSVLSAKTDIYLIDIQAYLSKNPKTPNVLEIIGSIGNIKNAQKKKDISLLQLSSDSLKKIMRNISGFSTFISNRKKERTLAKRKREKERALARKKLLKKKIQIARTYENYLTAYATKNMLKDSDTVQKILPHLKKLKAGLESPKLDELNPIIKKTATFILLRPTLKNVALKLNLTKKSKTIERARKKRLEELRKKKARKFSDLNLFSQKQERKGKKEPAKRFAQQFKGQMNLGNFGSKRNFRQKGQNKSSSKSFTQRRGSPVSRKKPTSQSNMHTDFQTWDPLKSSWAATLKIYRAYRYNRSRRYRYRHCKIKFKRNVAKFSVIERCLDVKRNLFSVNDRYPPRYRGEVKRISDLIQGRGRHKGRIKRVVPHGFGSTNPKNDFYGKKLVYVGEFKEGVMHGKGILRFETTNPTAKFKYRSRYNYFLGYFRNGQPYGKGRILVRDAYKFYDPQRERNFRRRKQSYELIANWNSSSSKPFSVKYNVATIKYSDGREYHGKIHFLINRPISGIRHIVLSGHGTMTWKNGNKYVGNWSYLDDSKVGVRHGKGTMTWANGKKFSGMWNNGKKGKSSKTLRAEAAKAKEKQKLQDKNKQRQDFRLGILHTYMRHKFIEHCHEVRKGYAYLYINNIELKRSKERMSSVDQTFQRLIKKDSPKNYKEILGKLWDKSELDFLNLENKFGLNIKDVIEFGKNPYGKTIPVTTRREICQGYYKLQMSRTRHLTPTKRKRKNF